MAIFNEILSGRFNRALQKLFAIKGSPPVRQLGGEIMPVHVLFSGVENRFIESWNRYTQLIAQAGAAGVHTAIRFRNPTGSKVIAVFERIRILGQPAADIPFITFLTGLADAAGPVTFVRSSVDLRGAANSSLVISSGQPAITGSTFFQGNQAINTDLECILKVDDQLILAPGDTMTLYSNNLNTVLQVTFLWRERALEESELQ